MCALGVTEKYFCLIDAAALTNLFWCTAYTVLLLSCHLLFRLAF